MISTHTRIEPGGRCSRISSAPSSPGSLASLEAAGIGEARAELVELIAGMPRYRVYPRADDALSVDDEHAIDVAERTARTSGRCDETRLGAILAVLRGASDDCPARRELRERFQQVAGAVMAKGVEDTAFYRYVRLVALNEVGSDPDRMAGLDEFHATCRASSREASIDIAGHDHARHQTR